MFEYLVSTDSRFTEISPGALYEQAVERLVLRHAEALFPAFITRSCTPKIHSAFGNRQPDLILVSRTLESWGIIEVELEEHSAANHVQPQIAVFANAELDTGAVSAIQSSFRDCFDSHELEVVLRTQPRVFLITHGTCQVSDDHLKRLNVEKIDLKIFKGGANQYLLQVHDGSRAHEILGGTFTQLSNPMFASTWVYRGPHLDSIPQGTNRVAVEFDQAVELWTVTTTSDGYLFKPPHHLENSLTGIQADLGVLESDRSTLKVVRK